MDAAVIELRERLAQLREGFRVEGSAKMAEPENERGAIGPELGEAVGVSAGGRVAEIRSWVADVWFGRHMPIRGNSTAAILAQKGRVRMHRLQAVADVGRATGADT